MVDGNGQCVYCIGHHLPPNRRSLPGIVVTRVGKTALRFVEGFETPYARPYLLPRTVKRWANDALAINAQRHAEIEVSLASPG